MDNIKKELPILKTDRLTLRPINLTDIDDMFEYSTKDNVGPRAGWLPHITIYDTKVVIENMMKEVFTDSNIGVFSIVLNEINKMVGTIGLHRYNERLSCVEIGYVLNPNYWGMGIVQEGSIEVIKWCFDVLNIFRIECSHYDFNIQSKRVIEKLGFKLEGISRKKILLLSGNRCDLYNYSILKTEYENNELPWQK